MHTGEGRFFIEGTGFLWSETDSDLELSNQVHSILHSETTNGSPPSETVIHSDRFSYEMKTGLAVYRDNVRVDDPKMKLTCETLTANLANPSAFSASDIINLPSLAGMLKQPSGADKVSQYLAGRLSAATQKLLSDYEGGTNSRLQQALTEDFNQVIQSGPMYDAERFAGVKLSPETSSLLAKTPTGADLVHLNRLLLQDAYPLEISRGLLAQAGGRPDNIVAEKNVIIDYSDNGELTHATGEKAVYNKKTTGTVTNEAMQLTGNPRLARTKGWMTADVLIMDQAVGIIRGVGNYHSVFKKPPPSAGKTNGPAIADTEIFCDNFEYNTKTHCLAVYRGNVRVNDPQMKLTSKILTANLPEKGGNPDHIVAETNVVIDFIQKDGQTHATGEKAIYDRKIVGGKTNELMELRGNPRVERTNGWMVADVILMDRGEGVIQGIGNHHTIIKKQAGPGQAKGPATADTDIFSDGFNYKMNTRLAVYLGHVRVNAPADEAHQ